MPRFWSESFFGSPWSLINSNEWTNNLSTSLIIRYGEKNHIELSLDFRISTHDFQYPFSSLLNNTYIRKKDKKKISTREINWFSNSHSETWNPNSTSLSMWKMCQMKFMSCNLRRIREITKFASTREKSERERGRQQTATTSFQPKNTLTVVERDGMKNWLVYYWSLIGHLSFASQTKQILIFLFLSSRPSTIPTLFWLLVNHRAVVDLIGRKIEWTRGGKKTAKAENEDNKHMTDSIVISILTTQFPAFFSSVNRKQTLHAALLWDLNFPIP